MDGLQSRLRQSCGFLGQGDNSLLPKNIYLVSCRLLQKYDSIFSTFTCRKFLIEVKYSWMEKYFDRRVLHTLIYVQTEMEITMKINIDLDRKKAPLGDMFGIFFEDLNHAADGGLYAELVRNRSFEFCGIDNKDYTGLTAWEKVENDGEVELSVEEGDAVSKKNPHCLVMRVTKAGSWAGVCNRGFHQGIPLDEKETYYFTCYAKKGTEGGIEKLKASLMDEQGEVLAEESFFIEEQWKKFEFLLKPEKTVQDGKILITAFGEGTVKIDFVSLFPKHTYKNRRNGLRKDLAEALEQLHPKFMRFPGGCLVHDGTLDAEDRGSQYRWKNTIGPLEERSARRNNWQYNQTLGLGYYEYFQFCEDIGAKPLPVLPGGYDPHHGRAAEGEVLQEYIQDALDLIEFANGAPDTRWGAVRAELGHKEPFHLEYIGIGNEEVGEAFFERFPLFLDAIRKKYPEIKIIGTSGPFAAGGEYERGWKSARENAVDLVDEHYYMAPEWFLANVDRYDTFDAAGPKVFLGEYASWGNTWYNALCEAAYMTGLQNNAAVVGLACYAPLFCNVDYINWQPDMIWFNQNTYYLTPNYYVQKLYMHHQGDVLLEHTLSENEEKIEVTSEPDRISGEIVLGSDQSEVVYSGIEVVDETTGEIQAFPDVTVSEEHPEYRLLEVNSTRYTLRCKAREVKGIRGFKLIFGRKEGGNQCYWQLGGWQNMDSIIGEVTGGRDSCLFQKEGHVEPGKTYAMEIHVDGRNVTTFLDGREESRALAKPVILEPLYVTVSQEEQTGDVLIKLVNVSSKEQTAEISFAGSNVSGWQGTAYQMKGYELSDKNDFAVPAKVVPVEKEIKFNTGDFVWKMEKESFCVLRIHAM